MRIDIIQIGNSRGVRLPKAILRQCHIGEQVDAEITSDRIVLKPVKKDIRKDWDAKFLAMNNNKQDTLLIDDYLDLDKGDWKW
ncbi:AbrB/MazE/SpoVT family DNA-binding domain-containing protein [bacterium]|nr:AbrB/MazE/SpoVT family DNA-binding domain-containing protein [bacterium]